MKLDFSKQIPDMEIVWFRGRWAAYWRHNGKPERRSLRTTDYNQARANLLDMRRRMTAAFSDGTVGGIYSNYMLDLQERYGEVPNTVYWVWRVANPFWAALRPDQIDRERCREYIRLRRANGLKDGSIRREMVQIAAAVRWKDKNTPAVFEYPQESEPKEFHLTKEQYVALRDGAIAGGAPHVALYMELARATAARMGAILDLRWSQVNLEKRFITLRRADQSEEAIMGRKRKPRATVPIPDRLVEMLQRYKNAALTEHVIEYAGQPIKSVKRAFARSVERAGFDEETARRTTPHVIRHSVAIWMAEDDVPMTQIQQYLGHTDIEITIKHYARYTPSFLRGAMKSIDF